MQSRTKAHASEKMSRVGKASKGRRGVQPVERRDIGRHPGSCISVGLSMSCLGQLQAAHSK